MSIQRSLFDVTPPATFHAAGLEPRATMTVYAGAAAMTPSVGDTGDVLFSSEYPHARRATVTSVNAFAHEYTIAVDSDEEATY